MTVTEPLPLEPLPLEPLPLEPLPLESPGSPRCALPYSARSPALAREWVREALVPESSTGRRGRAAISPDVIDTVEILTSELVTNAVLHGRSMVVVRIGVVADTIQVLVEDTSVALPRPRSSEGPTEAGRGLLLVDGLASSWGWGLLDTGKHVWFQLDLAS